MGRIRTKLQDLTEKENDPEKLLPLFRHRSLMSEEKDAVAKPPRQKKLSYMRYLKEKKKWIDMTFPSTQVYQKAQEHHPSK